MRHEIRWKAWYFGEGDEPIDDGEQNSFYVEATSAAEAINIARKEIVERAREEPWKGLKHGSIIEVIDEKDVRYDGPSGERIK